MESSSQRIEQAAYNNAMWCDTVCRAHGIPGEFHRHIWLNRQPMLPYYPNAVTLSGSAGGAEQIAALRDLITLGKTGTVKDSFLSLDLAPLGFQPLFDASWVWLDAGQIQSEPDPGIAWSVIDDPDDLQRWETAWAGLEPSSDLRDSARIFRPALLPDQDVRFVAAMRDGHIVAGAILNRTGDVLGVSNQFAIGGMNAAHLVSCLHMAARLFPGLPIVGYQHSEAFELATNCGFAALGPLRIWTRPA